MSLSKHDLFHIFVKDETKISTTSAKAGDCYPAILIKLELDELSENEKNVVNKNW